jgi:hypothetical protein
MKALLLAMTISLATPAYALPSDTDCDQLKQSSDKLCTVIENAKTKDLPLTDADKKEMNKAIEDFDKALKNFYEIEDKKVATKKHPKLKSIGHGFLAVVGGLRSTRTAGYGNPFYTGIASPNMMPTTFINPMPAYGQSAFTTFTPGFGNTYTVFHLPGF